MNTRLFAVAAIFVCSLLLKFGAPLLPVVLGLGAAAAYQYRTSLKPGNHTR